MRSRRPTRDTFLVDSRDIDEKMAGASRVVKATYRYPYQMHGSIGSSCAVADVQADQATIWSATQAVYPLRSTAAMVLGLKPENVRVILQDGLGMLRINGADTVFVRRDDALAGSRPTRPRAADAQRRMAWENYGVAFVIDERVGVDTSGEHAAGITNPGPPRLRRSAWRQTIPVMSSRVIWPASLRSLPSARTPAPNPTSYGNDSNAVPSYVTGCVGDHCGGTGTIRKPACADAYRDVPFLDRTTAIPERLQNTFAHESFMDEIAAAIKRIQWRTASNISGTRVSSKSSKRPRGRPTPGTRPSPRPGVSRGGPAIGRGISCVLYEGDNGYCAMVAEVEVDQDTGGVRSNGSSSPTTAVRYPIRTV